MGTHLAGTDLESRTIDTPTRITRATRLGFIRSRNSRRESVWLALPSSPRSSSRGAREDGTGALPRLTCTLTSFTTRTPYWTRLLAEEEKKTSRALCAENERCFVACARPDMLPVYVCMYDVCVCMCIYMCVCDCVCAHSHLVRTWAHMRTRTPT